MLPPIWSEVGADDVHADAATRDGGDLGLGRQAGHEHQLHAFAARQGIGRLAGDQLGADRPGGQALRIDAAAVVGQLEADPPALV